MSRLICDYCWSGQPAREVIVRDPLNRRGTRRQACQECIDEKLRALGYIVTEPRRLPARKI